MGVHIGLVARLAQSTESQVCSIGSCRPIAFQSLDKSSGSEAIDWVIGFPEEIKVGDPELRLAILLPTIVGKRSISVFGRYSSKITLMGNQKIVD